MSATLGGPIPLATPNLSGDEAALLAECIRSTFVSSVGPFVDEFEAMLGAASGQVSASVVCSGTVALQIALEALGIGEGDLVMMPTLTFIATSNAITHSGARPWLVDVTAGDWMLDLALCRQLIETETEATPMGRRHIASGRMLKALMPVMVMGAVPDLDSYVALAQEYGLRVVVDAAAAIGTTMADGRGIAATGVDAVCYSFNGNKTITTGGGGAVAAADPDLIRRIRHLCSTGRVGAAYDHDIVAYNFRMTNVQAALGVAQMRRLPDFLRRKAEIRDHYAEFARQHPDLQPFPEPPYGHNGHWFSGFWYTGDDMPCCDAFRNHMRSAGVDLRPFWKPIHLQQPYLTALATPMPVADRLWQRIFPLPCSTHLTEGQLAQVTDAAATFWHGA